MLDAYKGPHTSELHPADSKTRIPSVEYFLPIHGTSRTALPVHPTLIFMRQVDLAAVLLRRNDDCQLAMTARQDTQPGTPVRPTARKLPARCAMESVGRRAIGILRGRPCLLLAANTTNARACGADASNEPLVN